MSNIYSFPPPSSLVTKCPQVSVFLSRAAEGNTLFPHIYRDFHPENGVVIQGRIMQQVALWSKAP